MLRKLLGRFVEYLLSYEHEVTVAGEVPDDGAWDKMPYHKYVGDAGYDLFAARDVPIAAGQTAEVPAGLRIDPLDRIWFEVKARSSTMKVRGLEVVGAVIDRDYRGNLMAVVHNPTAFLVTVKAGDRIVQIVPHRLIPCRFVPGKLRQSPRGQNGFGSTGT
jgi:dUTP pyrophosphatase